MFKLIENANVKIDKLVPGGQGIATLDSGKKGFFWNALPGETVTSYEVFKNKSKYFEATALTIENPSAHRIPPRDNVHLSTSPWQIMDYQYELEKKRELLLESFRQEGIEDLEIPEVMTDGHEFFYRNKMEYSLYWNIEKQKIELAFRRRGTHRKEPIKTSSLERPEIFKKAQEIIADLNARGEEAYKYQSLLLRCNQKGEVSGGLYENKKPHPVFENLTDTLLGHEYSYSPNGFFQINLPVYELALEEIKKHISTASVLDLYAGVGTIGLSVARNHNLTLVEVDKHAFRELENNCQNTSAHPILAKSEEVLEYIESDQTVILDPPRAGADKKLLDRLLEVTPKTLIYLSCNPSTQARDVKILLEKYDIIKVQPFNFFPRTPHLENLVVLRRK